MINHLLLFLNVGETEEETEEERYDRLNYESISPLLWNMFPTNGDYIKQIMQFCGYYNRESILRLKDKGEQAKMFKFIADRQELVEDKKSTFGVFAAKPSLLTILPGLEPILKRFIAKVEDIIPKKQSSNARSTEKMSKKVDQQPPSSSSSSSASDVTMPTVEVLVERLIKWLNKQIDKLQKDIGPEEVRHSFRIQSTANNSYVFTCLQTGCHRKFMLYFVKSSVSVKMSNVQRHITDSCWLSSTIKRQRKFTTAPPSNTFFDTKPSKRPNVITESMSEGPPVKRMKNDGEREERITLHQDVEAYDHHMNRGPPPANVDFASNFATSETEDSTPEHSTSLFPPTDQSIHSTNVTSIHSTTPTYSAAGLITHSSINKSNHSSNVTTTHSTTTSMSKNLYLPAGHQEVNVFSGL